MSEEISKQSIKHKLAQLNPSVNANPVTYASTVTYSDAVSYAGDVAVATNKFTIAAATGNTAVKGDFAVNTNKFAVLAASGNTTVAGTLHVTSDVAVNTDKFNVAASSGNTLVGGTLGVTGASSLAAVSATNVTTTGYNIRSVGNGLTAAGTTRTDALQLAKEVNNVTTAAASTGVILPVGVVGMRIRLFNNGVNAIKVYASGSETIDTVAGSTGVTLTNAKRADFEFVAANTWISCQLGVVAA